MPDLATIEPVDYLIIGHITQDVTPAGLSLGGTASYAALTARAFGLRVGIVTSCSPDLQPPELNGIAIARKPSPFTSTFRNTYTPTGRIQHILHVADLLSLEDVPPAWRSAPIVHLGPLAEAGAGIPPDPACSPSEPFLPSNHGLPAAVSFPGCGSHQKSRSGNRANDHHPLRRTRYPSVR